jgi:hypothetical protein
LAEQKWFNPAGLNSKEFLLLRMFFSRCRAILLLKNPSRTVSFYGKCCKNYLNLTAPKSIHRRRQNFLLPLTKLPIANFPNVLVSGESVPASHSDFKRRQEEGHRGAPSVYVQWRSQHWPRTAQRLPQDCSDVTS